MPSLQLKYGDLVLDVVEAWSESLDWPVQAYAIPGAWAGCAIARRAAPRRISIRGFVGKNVADPTITHRENLSTLIARINDAVEYSKRYSTKVLWQLWFFDDRYIACRPLSFAFEHIEGIAWASRFSAEFVAPDPRWHSSGTSNDDLVVGGTSVWASMGISSPGDAPCEPRFQFSAQGISQFSIANFYKNRLENAALRDVNAGTSGVPLHWAVNNASSSYNQHVYGEFDDDFGKAYLRSITPGTGSNFLYQDVLMSEPGTIWSLASRVATNVVGPNQDFHVELQFLSLAKKSLATHVSSLITTPNTEQTLTVLNKTAPVGTQYIRVAIVFNDAAGTASGTGFFKWAQLERAASNTTPEFKGKSVMTFTSTQFPYSMQTWIDFRARVAYYIGTTADGTQVNLLGLLSDGNFWSLEPGANELLLEVYGASSQSLNVKWENAWWAK